MTEPTRRLIKNWVQDGEGSVRVADALIDVLDDLDCFKRDPGHWTTGVVIYEIRKSIATSLEIPHV